MGLSSKQVSSDGLGWSQTLLQAQTLELPKPLPMRRQQQQNQQQQSEPLKCPRCDSSNTKFCYYNNYNKTQPRHFCRACKRHWTKGGTLRNVPVGGGRKNKRPKKSTTAASASASASASTRTSTTTSGLTTNKNISDRVLNTHLAVQAEHQRQNLPLLAHGDQKSMPEIFYQALIRPPSSLPQQNLMNSIHLDSKNFSNNNGIFFGSSSTLQPVSAENQSLRFPFSSSISFNTNPSSISTSFQSSNVFNYPEELKTVEEQTISNTSRTATQAQPWQIPATSSGMDMTSYWNWDDINTFASADLNIPWDDSDIKP